MIGMMLALSLAGASPQPDMVARGRAFMKALLSPTPPRAMPYAAPNMKYRAFPNPTVQHRLPKVANTLAGFRAVLRGCKLVDVGPSDVYGRPLGSEPFVDIELDCPEDFAHANGELYLHLDFANGSFVEAHLQIGLGPAPTMAPS